MFGTDRLVEESLHNLTILNALVQGLRYTASCRTFAPTIITRLLLLLFLLLLLIMPIILKCKARSSLLTTLQA